MQIQQLYSEMSELKKCQLELIKIAVAMFAAISTVLAAFIGKGIFASINDDHFGSCCAFLIFLSIIPLTFPYFAWIIIYKSRALFRLSSYLRLLEEDELDNIRLNKTSNPQSVRYIGYETLYREMRNDHWLKQRFTTSKLVNFIYLWLPYYFWKQRYKAVDNTYHYKDLIETIRTNPYLGAYYHRLVKFLFYMVIPFLIIGFIFSGNCLLEFYTGELSIKNYRIVPFVIYICLFTYFILF